MTDDATPMKFEHATKLAELAASRFDKRREYEWKVMLGVWVVMLAAFSKQVDYVVVPHLGSWLTLMVFLFSATWIRGIWRGNTNDKDRYEYFLDLAERAARGDVKGKEGEELPSYPEKITVCDSWFRFWWTWNPLFQIVATAAIAALVCYTKAVK